MCCIRFCRGGVITLAAVNEGCPNQRRKVFATVVVVVLNWDILLFLLDFYALFLKAASPLMFAFLTVCRIRTVCSGFSLSCGALRHLSVNVVAGHNGACESGVR